MLIWNILSWIVFGLVAGALARLLTPGRDPMGVGMTMALGIVGAFVGGLVVWLLSGAPANAFSPSGIIGAVLGGIGVLLAYRYSQERTTFYR
jgi:uncharacterized membrane protein YeaQ/YmgE (transglycosylase-associated protein family)